MKAEFQFIKMSGNRNVVFLLKAEGFVGIFRITFVNGSKKNGSLILTPTGCFFEGLTKEDQYSNCFEIRYTTDAMLYVDRHVAFILDQLRKDIKEHI